MDVQTTLLQVEGYSHQHCPDDAYRVLAGPQRIYVLERLWTCRRANWVLDPWELRRINFIKPNPNSFLYPATGELNDVGDSTVC